MMQDLTGKKYISSLNLLRGFAALSVCCFHILAKDIFGEYSWIKAVFSKGYLGLDLFFIISGFVIPYSMYQNKYMLKKIHLYLLKRSIRIEPPYIISFLLIVAMRIIFVTLHNWKFPQDHYVYEHNWKQFLLHFLYLNQYFGYESYTAVYWTLAIEFQFYILMGLLFPIMMISNKIIPVILLAVFCCLIWFLNLPYNWFIFQYGYLFIAGILTFLYYIKRFSFFSFFALLGIVLILMYFKNEIEVVITTLVAIAGILFIRKEWKITNFLGKISYSFYLVHFEAAGWFILYLTGVITNNLILRVTAVLFAILFATGFYYLFERPSLRLSKKISYREK
jgi:peptidoglycan/LPS O-acetylase OafA/YrhL